MGAQPGRERRIRWDDPLPRVQQQHRRIRRGQRGCRGIRGSRRQAAARRGGLQAGRVEGREGQTAECRPSARPVSSHVPVRRVPHQGGTRGAPCQRIEQGRLADVGAADQGDDGEGRVIGVRRARAGARRRAGRLEDGADCGCAAC